MWRSLQEQCLFSVNNARSPAHKPGAEVWEMPLLSKLPSKISGLSPGLGQNTLSFLLAFSRSAADLLLCMRFVVLLRDPVPAGLKPPSRWPRVRLQRGQSSRSTLWPLLQSKPKPPHLRCHVWLFTQREAQQACGGVDSLTARLCPGFSWFFRSSYRLSECGK